MLKRRSSSEGPFRVFVKREPGYELTLTCRFEVLDGMGVLGIRRPGRADPEASTQYEETELEADALRAGRFIHVLQDGRRQSYALSRLTAELLNRISTERWCPLEPVTEFGFRYLVLPEEALDDAAGAAAVAAAPAAAVSAPSGPAARAARGPAARGMSTSGGRPAPKQAPRRGPPRGTARPAPVASTRSGGPGASRVSGSRPGMPPRGTSLAPDLADAALSKLSPAEALDRLRKEMAKVEQLHRRVEELQDRLRASGQREKDLLELLGKWQEREATIS